MQRGIYEQPIHVDRDALPGNNWKNTGFGNSDYLFSSDESQKAREKSKKSNRDRQERNKRNHSGKRYL